MKDQARAANGKQPWKFSGHYLGASIFNHAKDRRESNRLTVVVDTDSRTSPPQAHFGFVPSLPSELVAGPRRTPTVDPSRHHGALRTARSGGRFGGRFYRIKVTGPSDINSLGVGKVREFPDLQSPKRERERKNRRETLAPRWTPKTATQIRLIQLTHVKVILNNQKMVFTNSCQLTIENWTLCERVEGTFLHILEHILFRNVFSDFMRCCSLRGHDIGTIG